MNKGASTDRTLTIIIIMAALVIAAVLFVSVWQSRKVKSTSEWINHTEEVLHHIQKLVMSGLANETSARGYVISGKEEFLEPLEQSEHDIRQELAYLRTFTKDNPEQQARVDSLSKYVNGRIEFSKKVVPMRQQQGLAATALLIANGEGKFYTDKIRSIGEDMQQAENVLLEERKNKNEQTISQLNLILYSVLAIFLVLSVMTVHRIRMDMSRQVQNEKRFSALLDAAPDATVIVNESGIIQMVNRQAENLFGYSRSEMINKPVELLIPAELHIAHRHHRDSFVKKAKARFMGAGLELHAVKKNGIRFPVEISLSPIETKEGMLVSASVRDISIRKNLENNLMKSNAEMEAFTYSVSHDLRAPLRGIIGFTSMLEEDYTSKLDSEAQRITAVIKDNTLKMGRLIDDLLAFSRMGRQDMIKTHIDMDAMVKQVIQTVSDNKTRLIEWIVSPLPAVDADINLIRQVWINILSNAIKYTGNSPHPSITIGSFEQEDQVAFFVKDNGVGFDDKYKDKLFKVFQRLHRADEFEGTGIGLALVEKIISKHNGKVWADGAVAQGAVFYFSLPVMHIKDEPIN